MTTTKTTPKTLLLQIKDVLDQCKPLTYRIISKTDDGFIVTRTDKHRDGSSSVFTMTLTPKGDGFVNEYGCEFMIAKRDTRKKPYAIRGREFGQGPAFTEKFATLEELEAYVRGRWEGWDYADGVAAFHNDYVAYELIGATLEEVMGKREVISNSKGRPDVRYSWDDVVDVCITGNPAINGNCGDPDCICFETLDQIDDQILAEMGAAAEREQQDEMSAKKTCRLCHENDAQPGSEYCADCCSYQGEL